MNKARIFYIFRWAIFTFACGIALFSAYRWTLAQNTLPLLLLILSAIGISSRYRISIPHGQGYITLAESFIFLALLLFGGEAAILVAFLVAVSISLRYSTDNQKRFTNVALTVVSAFLIVWTVRFQYGQILESDRISLSVNFVYAVCFTIFVQALFTSLVLTIDGAYPIKRPKWRRWSILFLWSVIVRGVGILAATLTAALVNIIGFNISIAVLASLYIAYYIWSNYLMSVADRVQQSEQTVRKDITHYQNLARFRSAFDYASIGMAIVSGEGRWLEVNNSLCALLGYSEKELLKTDFLALTHQEDVPRVVSKMRDLLAGKLRSYQMEKRYIHKSGAVIWANWSVSLAHTVSQSSIHLIFQVQDITDRKRAEERLHHDAFHDGLTDLPNRALFIDHLKLGMARVKRGTESLAVVYLDIDRFKIINDSLGHMVGDQLLIGVAQRIQRCLRPADTIARLGGDEFAILLEDIEDVSEAVMVTERLHKELSIPFNLSGREVITTASMGIALYSAEYENPDEMIRDADTAMYRAKSLGKARHELFDRTMHDQAVERLQLETDLRGVLENPNELFLQYQPIMDLQKGRLCGFEALVRWRHSQHGFISPADFIPIAEEIGIINQIGEWVLRKACHQIYEWQTKFPSDAPLFMSVNLSGKQFNQPDLIRIITDILEESRLDPRSLKLEITESVVMENIEAATEMLNQLKTLGVKLSIDDFGTGYSSLSYLHRFPIDFLKIDRSFVTKMGKHKENLEIVRTIISLAKNLAMEVIAEGIETNIHFALLKKLGCQYGQGYLFARPLDGERAEEFIMDDYLKSTSQPFVTSSMIPLKEANGKTFSMSE